MARVFTKETYTLKDVLDIPFVATSITFDSEIFEDETQSVVRDLTSLWEDAQTYGTRFTREISDMWGGSVKVTALPLKGNRKERWYF